MRYEFTDEEIVTVANFCGSVLNQAPHLAKTKQGQVLLSFLNKAAHPIVDAGEVQTPKNVPNDAFEKICRNCDAFDGIKCDDVIQKKFPGKCDNILKYLKGAINEREATEIN